MIESSHWSGEVGELGHGFAERACHALGISPFPGFWVAAHLGENPSEHVWAAHQLVGKFAYGIHLTMVHSLVVLFFFAEVIPRHFGDEEAHARVHLPGLKCLHQSPHPICGFGVCLLTLLAQDIAEPLPSFRPRSRIPHRLGRQSFRRGQ